MFYLGSQKLTIKGSNTRNFYLNTLNSKQWTHKVILKYLNKFYDTFIMFLWDIN